jgi:hypothetical protein
MVPLVAIAAVDFVRGIEVVIDLDINLLAVNGFADSKAIVGARAAQNPTVACRIEAVADLVIVRHRHDIEQLRHVPGRIHASSIGIPGLALNNRVRAIRLRRSV